MTLRFLGASNALPNPPDVNFLVTISTSQIPTQFSRADLEFHGVDHSGASYEALVFINNPNDDENTPATEENGYVGSFYIFGHGGCFGDAGHCETNNARS